MRLRSKAVKILAAPIILLVLAAILYAGGEIYRRHDYRSEFLERKGRLVSVEETRIEQGPDHSLFQLRFANDSGIETQGYFRLPSEGSGPYPALVILGGVRTGRKTLDYVGPTEGLALLALDYPYEGKKNNLSAWEFVTGLAAMRQAVINTVPAVMLGVDYLLDRDDIDSERIVLIGGSVGAFFAAAVAAADLRIDAVVLLFGGGDLRAIGEANLDMPAIIARPAVWPLAVLVSPVEPLKYIDQIAPRPLLMLNGTDDPRIPERCSRLLHERAKDPKTIRWIPAGHVSVRTKKFRGLVGRELATWLVDNELISPGAMFPELLGGPSPPDSSH
ncbi:MAG: prolyl oligopeptidase family serine peptidase [Candidatus Krumholzibacteria bacterium]